MLRSHIVALVNELHLHNNRIEALVDQIYGINRRIVTIDSNVVKLADAARINRREFIDAYRGSELDPTWVERMMQNKGRGWQALFEKSRPQVENLRAEMAMVGQHVASISRNSAASSARSSAAKRNRARPRRKWSRRTCGW